MHDGLVKRRKWFYEYLQGLLTLYTVWLQRSKIFEINQNQLQQLNYLRTTFSQKSHWSFAFSLGWNDILPVIADHIIPQDTHQLSTCQPGSSRHLLRHIYYTNNYFKPQCRPSKGDPWDNFVRSCNRGRIQVDWSGGLNIYTACCCLWTILCRCTSLWKPRKANVSQSKGVFLWNKMLCR